MGRKKSSRGRSSASRRKTARTQSAKAPSTPAQARQHELNTKRRGELSELAFTHKAATLGFGVAKPYGDSERYDFILDSRDLNPRRPQNVILSGAKRKAKRAGLRSRRPALSEAEGTPSNSAPPPARQGVSMPATVAPPPDRLWRVQVKCSAQLVGGLYRTNAHRRINGRAVAYLPSEIDFFAAHVIPEDTWYIIPIRAVNGRTSLLFRRKRDRKPGMYDQYREAWDLLRPKLV